MPRVARLGRVEKYSVDLPAFDEHIETSVTRPGWTVGGGVGAGGFAMRAAPDNLFQRITATKLGSVFSIVAL
jgi:hypothetical protein